MKSKFFLVALTIISLFFSFSSFVKAEFICFADEPDGPCCNREESTCEPVQYNCREVSDGFGGYTTECDERLQCSVGTCLAYCDGSCSDPTPPPNNGYCGDFICQDGCPQGLSTCPEDCEDECAPQGPVCGNGTCDAGESCATCPECCSDGPTCGANGCEAGENCSNCPGDCGSCSGCGDGTCSAAENCSTCPGDCGACASLYCGDGSCNNGETCSSCAADCGACSGAFCGDGTCNGTEDCLTCGSDCGLCNTTTAWWQIQSGSGFAKGSSGYVAGSQVPDSDTCTTPNCITSVVRPDLDLTSLTDGFIYTGGGNVIFNGFASYRNPQVKPFGTSITRLTENYDFFYRRAKLGLAPSDTFTGEEDDALKPTTGETSYYHGGDITIQSGWDVADDESYVIFIDGNLTFSDPGDINQLITVEPGGFLAFIVSGDITFEENLGNETLTDTATNVEGVYLADGEIIVESRGADAGGDDRFVGAGTFVGWGGVELDRDFDDGADRGTENNDKPIELFIYRPDLVLNTPAIMKYPHRIWQETN